MTKLPLIVYHANCADGFGSAYAAWRKFKDEAEYLPMSYGEEPNEEIFYGREVYVVDFSLPDDLTEKVKSKALSFTWLDHHKTSFERVCGGIIEGGRYELINYDDNLGIELLRIVLDNNQSGALLSWEFFHPGKRPPQILQHVDDYDRWQFAMEDTREIMRAVWSYEPWNFKMWETWHFEKTKLALLRYEGKTLLREHERQIKESVKRSEACTINGINGLAVNCPAHLSSDVGHALANSSGTFGLCWELGRDEKVRCSLRSNGDFDVSVLAQQFGGGGHKNAAGFGLSIHDLVGFVFGGG